MGCRPSASGVAQGIPFSLVFALSGDFVGQREFRTFAEVLHVIPQIVGRGQSLASNGRLASCEQPTERESDEEGEQNSNSTC